MLYFTWGINPPGVDDARSALIEAHWKYMDRFDDRLVARGPTLSDSSPPAVTGSVHVVDLPDDRTARAFVDEEPFAANGLFDSLILSKFDSALDLTMFDFDHDPDMPHFLIYCPASRRVSGDLAAAHEVYCRDFDGIFLCRGKLLNGRGDWAGTMALVELPDRAAAEVYLAGDPFKAGDQYDAAEIHRWTPGGRANLNALGRIG